MLKKFIKIDKTNEEKGDAKVKDGINKRKGKHRIGVFII
jgi:hypothetical protein